MLTRFRPLMRRGAAVVATVAVGSVVIASPGTARTPLPIAHAAKACSVGTGEWSPYSYITSLTVSRTSCSTGKSVVKHKARLRGWSCHKKIIDRSSVQYDASESCKRGGERVQYTFTQNT